VPKADPAAPINRAARRAWQLRPHQGGPLVSHEFTHEGPLARVLSKAYRGVAELRLDRLAERAGRT
jgi:hypothetical protein